MGDTRGVRDDDWGDEQASVPIVDAALADALLARAEAEGIELLGPQGLLGQMTKAVLERALGEELTDHLGYGPHERAGASNSRNGEAADERCLSHIVARYGRLDLLCLDELGYVQLDARGSELLFQILTEREEKASVAVASNLPFSEWGSVIPDPRLVPAIVDRVTFNAHIIETGTDSYRLRTTKTRSPR